LREEHRLRVFGPKREEDGSWRKLNNNELYSLYSSLNIVRVITSKTMRWAGDEAHMGKGRGIYGVLVRMPKGKRQLGRPRHVIR
jgi:hypothetical protein